MFNALEPWHLIVLLILAAVPVALVLTVVSVVRAVNRREAVPGPPQE